MAWPTALPTAGQGAGLRFTTVTRLPDTMTSLTSAPGMAKIASASGEPRASSGVANRPTPPPCSGSLTRNLQRPLSIGSAVMRMSPGVICGNLTRRSGRRPHRAHLPRRLNHVPQRGERLLPRTRLQPAVGVHPDLPVVEDLLHALQRLHDLGGARHARRMDVVDAGPNFVGISVLLESVEQLRP